MHQHELHDAPRILFKMNHENGGFDCPGCAWPDDRNGLRLDLCENGIKHSTWEMTSKRADGDFFAAHSVSELSTWSDFALEDVGRLTEPLIYDPSTDHYVPISWDDAFERVGRCLRNLDSPDRAAFYTSGRLGNEASFLSQWFVREFGTNNFPDCSNMCHEASGVALHASLGTAKGTVDVADWNRADAIFLFGVNAASNAPRMLTSLATAYRRGAQLVHINPLIEAAATRTIVPHEVLSMATMRSTPTSSMNVQPRIGGDLALVRGMAKALFESAHHDPVAIDQTFLERFTDGVDGYRQVCEATTWDDIVWQSGVSELRIRELSDVYRTSHASIFAWCLGVTQQRHGVDTIRELINLLLLRGNIGRPGAGPCPIRGHSNVQGNRTCGIDHHPAPEFLERVGAACGITPPHHPGRDVVATLAAMQSGDISVFVAMGGNFALAAPDTAATFKALRRCEMTVQVSTKLNRSHLVHGRQALILPCRSRTERDVQASGVQSITVEDSMSMVHLSVGLKKPASPDLRSEPAIIAGMAKATLPHSTTPWDELVGDYDLIRDRMAQALEGFEDFNRRVRHPLGFRIHQPARERIFVTGSGRAEFSHAALPDVVTTGGRLLLSTMRSHDQFNTTIYSDDDRYRGVRNLRTALFMNADDMAVRGIADLDRIDITALAADGSSRTAFGYRAVAYDIPRGCVAGYMPELNVLCAIDDFSADSRQPLMKHVEVAVVASPSLTI
jgi:molybdopterin-dependent oxidoreductase alpha subunit